MLTPPAAGGVDLGGSVVGHLEGSGDDGPAARVAEVLGEEAVGKGARGDLVALRSSRYFTYCSPLKQVYEALSY